MLLSDNVTSETHIFNTTNVAGTVGWTSSRPVTTQSTPTPSESTESTSQPTAEYSVLTETSHTEWHVTTREGDITDVVSLSETTVSFTMLFDERSTSSLSTETMATPAWSPMVTSDPGAGHSSRKQSIETDSSGLYASSTTTFAPTSSNSYLSSSSHVGGRPVSAASESGVASVTADVSTGGSGIQEDMTTRRYSLSLTGSAVTVNTASDAGYQQTGTNANQAEVTTTSGVVIGTTVHIQASSEPLLLEPELPVSPGMLRFWQSTVCTNGGCALLNS